MFSRFEFKIDRGFLICSSRELEKPLFCFEFDADMSVKNILCNFMQIRNAEHETLGYLGLIISSLIRIVFRILRIQDTSHTVFRISHILCKYESGTRNKVFIRSPI